MSILWRKQSGLPSSKWQNCFNRPEQTIIIWLSEANKQVEQLTNAEVISNKKNLERETKNENRHQSRTKRRKKFNVNLIVKADIFLYN